MAKSYGKIVRKFREIFKRLGMIRVAIIIENEERQRELKNFLEAQPELTCSFAVGSVDKFQQMAKAYSNLQLVIIDINEEALSKILPSQLRKIKEINSGTELLILADREDTRQVISWLRAGVVGYLPKHTTLGEIKEAIMGIRHGEARITPFMVRQMLDFLRAKADIEEVLTEREKEIVQCLVEGMSYKLIACQLNIALDTVRYHLRNIYKKLQVNSKAQVISKAIIREQKHKLNFSRKG